MKIIIIYIATQSFYFLFFRDIYVRAFGHSFVHYVERVKYVRSEKYALLCFSVYV